MKAEKEFKAEDGSAYRIIMKLSTFSSDSYGRWSIDVYKKEKNRRMWYKTECKECDSYTLTYAQREKCYMDFILNNVKMEWIEELRDYILLKMKNDLILHEQE